MSLVRSLGSLLRWKQSWRDWSTLCRSSQCEASGAVGPGSRGLELGDINLRQLRLAENLEQPDGKALHGKLHDPLSWPLNRCLGVQISGGAGGMKRRRAQRPAADWTW